MDENLLITTLEKVAKASENIININKRMTRIEEKVDNLQNTINTDKINNVKEYMREDDVKEAIANEIKLHVAECSNCPQQKKSIMPSDLMGWLKIIIMMVTIIGFIVTATIWLVEQKPTKMDVITSKPDIIDYQKKKDE